MGAVIKSGNKTTGYGGSQGGMNPPKKVLLAAGAVRLLTRRCMQYGITNPNDNEGLMDLISCGSHLGISCDRTRQCGGKCCCASYKSNWKIVKPTKT